MRRRILLMYITARSGHCRAAWALEQAIRRLEPGAEILAIDAFQYLNPILARIVDRMYLSVIHRLPELWDYLYDHPGIVRRSARFRRLLHRYDSPRLKGLWDEFQPEVVACTQAFPCGLVADYKRQNSLAVPLYAILTDFTPHAFWVHERIDGYVVPCERAGQWLRDRRVDPSRIHVLGIPIDPAFQDALDPGIVRRRLQMPGDLPAVLLMGGGQGLGPIVEAVEGLDAIPNPFALLVVAGSNESLYHRLIKRAPSLRHPIQVFGHVDFVADLMTVAALIVTKPGGLTSSEALAKGLPIIALDPIPGQEIKNAGFLAEEGSACLVEDPGELPRVVQRLLENPEEIRKMSDNARRLGRARSASESARLILGR